MIAYNKTWLTNLHLQNAVESSKQKSEITTDEYQAITKAYPVGFYTPNLFVRAALCVLVAVIVLFSDGLLSLMMSTSGIVSTGGWMIFLGALTYGALELMINQNHYRSGVDDGLSFIAGCQLVGGIAMLIHLEAYYDFGLAISSIILIISAWFTLRFADALMSTICCGSLCAFVFYLWIQLIPGGFSTAPFAIMIIGGLIYLAAIKAIKKPANILYDNCLIAIQLVALLALYAAGNYYVIQSLGEKLAGTHGPVPFGGLFWAWTMLMPFVYIYFGIRKKDSLLLRLGLLLVAAAIATFRNYYHVLPIATALTIGGALLLATAYGLIKYLKTPKHGFTYAEPDELNELDELKVESLIAAQSFSHAPAAPAHNDGVEFGGGSFGGGGSSGEF